MVTAEKTRLGVQFLWVRNRRLLSIDRRVNEAIAAITRNTEPLEVQRVLTNDRRCEKVTFYWEAQEAKHRAQLTGFVHGALAMVVPGRKMTLLALTDVPDGMQLDAPLQLTDEA